ncbi:hypothetical protein JNB88_22790 [Rhizobium cauense]|uniref:hypothetical protein n=1 Tax=Rhizobium cauense TaxID=1166683 RepID=UPI001C6DD530|nr:hypothetical protein [Rhizobium cauense]MBW9116468.1 hypothetical protein [Rhizobium cauense]
MPELNNNRDSIPDVRGAERNVEPHLQPPDGLSSELHEVNLCLTALSLRAHANLKWFDNEDLDFAAARRTAAQLVDSIGELQTLIARLQ